MKPMQNILVVEDNQADAMILKESFKKSNPDANLSVVEDGDEALDYLHRRNAYKDASVPDIVLLDLNLPRVDGHTVLKEIKSDKELSKIPVIVLTSSSAENDISRSYQNHASGYIIKPLGFEKTLKMVSILENYWFGLVKLSS